MIDFFGFLIFITLSVDDIVFKAQIIRELVVN
jgi:hypothetical protein